MPYHINAENISLGDLQTRIETADLVPSRACLTNNIEEKMRILEKCGITTLAALMYELKNAKRLAALAEASDLDPEFLNLLRREINGYFPKPAPLGAFEWMPKEEIETLKQNGVKNTAILYERTSSPEKRSELIRITGVDAEIIKMLAQLADLTRVQWVSPTFARMLIEAGYHSPAELATADADELCNALAHVNADGRYYQGTIGLRDIKRLIHAANYIG